MFSTLVLLIPLISCLSYIKLALYIYLSRLSSDLVGLGVRGVWLGFVNNGLRLRFKAISTDEGYGFIKKYTVYVLFGSYVARLG